VVCPRDRVLEEGNGFLRTVECTERLSDRVARERDPLRVLRVALAGCEGATEAVERRVVLSHLVLLPAEVVEERASPVRRALVLLGEIDPARRPLDEAVAVGRDERGHVSGVRGDEPALVGDCGRERRLEEWARLVGCSAGSEETPALEIDACTRHGAVTGE